jgi:hypothetical protein
MSMRKPAGPFNRRQIIGSGLALLAGLSLPRPRGLLNGSAGIVSRPFTDETDEFTAASRGAIEKGTNWMLKAINRDGGSALDPGGPSDVAVSGVVGLALMSQGSTPIEGQYAARQTALMNYLIRRVGVLHSGGTLQQSTAQIEGKLGPNAAHFFCAICLSQMLGETDEVSVCRQALQRLANHIGNNQKSDGSWGQEGWAPQLATATGWISLRAANFAGIRVSASSDKTGDFLIKSMPAPGNPGASGSWYHWYYGTAAGLRVLYALGREEEERARQALNDLLDFIRLGNQAFGMAGGEEFLTHHYLNETFLQKGGQLWRDWFPLVRDKLIAIQNSDGSWTGHHCITSRVFCTACALLVLTSPNRFLPISQV